MHELGSLLLMTLISFGETQDTGWRNFDYSSLQNFNISNLAPILNPATFTEMAALYGHTAESYDVITEDDYILTLFRLRGNRQTLPILLFHGVTDSSDTWIIRGETSLAVTLANANYDVWLGNVRGNRYSRRHRVLKADVDPAFWDFSFDEYGLYDLPATIDFVLNNTGAAKLNMFGHSQGTVMMWTLLSTRTEYNNKINVATALAPVCYLKHIQPPLRTIIRLAPAIYSVLRALRVTNLFGDNSAATLTIRAISQVPVIGYLIVGYGIVFPIAGDDSTELEPTFLSMVSLHFPTWTSLKNLAHYAQVGLSNIFRRFDYGEVGNLAAYNSTTAPVYNLQNVTTRVVLLAAFNDKLAPIADVEMLRRQLPNVVRYVINPRLVMNHIDFIWGRTAPTYLYRYIFNVLENYN